MDLQIPKQLFGIFPFFLDFQKKCYIEAAVNSDPSKSEPVGWSLQGLKIAAPGSGRGTNKPSMETWWSIMPGSDTTTGITRLARSACMSTSEVLASNRRTSRAKRSLATNLSSCQWIWKRALAISLEQYNRYVMDLWNAPFFATNMWCRNINRNDVLGGGGTQRQVVEVENGGLNISATHKIMQL